MAEKKEKTTKKSFIYGLGRRRRSNARVRLFEGKGEIQVNGISIADYFKEEPQAAYMRPFDLTQTAGKFYATAKIEGGGKKGQLGAFILGVSRALVKTDEEKYKKLLRDAGFLTRDPRERERRKFGLAQGARARKQSPKR